jgi:SAM-dependent methyltransferase
LVTPKELRLNKPNGAAGDDARLPKGGLSPPDPPIDAASPFDILAADYDRNFTHTLIGRLMRQAVWSRLEACFGPGDRVLELNCGTGEDAVYLARRGVQVLATDSSRAMLHVARDKLRQARLEGAVTIQEFGLEEFARGSLPLLFPGGCQESPGRTPKFDGAFSNFGGLNCVADLPGVATGLASCLRPGATLLLCLMGPLALWEWTWFLWRRQPAKAFRRLNPRGVWWRDLRIRYPMIRTVRRAFAPHFQLRRLSAIGALLPPPYAEPWAVRNPGLISFLNRWERRLERLPPLPWLADHYLLEMVRR